MKFKFIFVILVLIVISATVLIFTLYDKNVEDVNDDFIVVDNLKLEVHKKIMLSSLINLDILACSIQIFPNSTSVAYLSLTFEFIK